MRTGVDHLVHHADERRCTASFIYSLSLMTMETNNKATYEMREWVQEVARGCGFAPASAKLSSRSLLQRLNQFLLTPTSTPTPSSAVRY